jgi:hypothetical protein
VVAGSTAHRGWQRIAHTLVVNPGCLADGSAAWLDRGRDEVDFLDLRPEPRPQRRPPSEQEIRLCAYLRWEATGRPMGDSTRFWQEAEEVLRREPAATRA